MSRRKLYPYLYNIPLGSARWYLWRGKGHPRIRVDPDVPDFDLIYGHFRAGISPTKKTEEPEPSEERSRQGTFQHGLLQVYKSVPFITWQERRKSQIRSILDDVADELVNPELKVGEVELNRFKLKDLNRLIARKIEDFHKWQASQQEGSPLRGKKKRGGYGAAVNRRKALRWLWAWFKENGFVKENVAFGLKPLKIPKEHQQRHTWQESEIRRYREYWAIGTKARLGFELGMAGLARSDAVKVGPANLKERNGVLWLEYYRAKTLHKDEPELAVVEVHEELSRAIKEHVPTRKDKHGNPVPVVGPTTFLVSDIGRFQYREHHYGARVFPKWVKAAGLSERCRPHGLRRASAVDLIHRGYSYEEINSAQGRAKGSKVISVYLKDLDKRRIADSAAARRRREQPKNE